jgi:predicted Holliday junction resolvase-like endonuclease
MRLALVVILIVVILIANFVLFYFLGIPNLVRELAKNNKRRKTPPKPEWIEMQTDVQQRAKERRRKEETQRREQNAARKRSGFYAELEQAYRKA